MGGLLVSQGAGRASEEVKCERVPEGPGASPTCLQEECSSRRQSSAGGADIRVWAVGGPSLKRGPIMEGPIMALAFTE